MTNTDITNLLFRALQSLDSWKINDVTTEEDKEAGTQIILTTTDRYDKKQCWVIDINGIREIEVIPHDR